MNRKQFLSVLCACVFFGNSHAMWQMWASLAVPLPGFVRSDRQRAERAPSAREEKKEVPVVMREAFSRAQAKELSEDELVGAVYRDSVVFQCEWLANACKDGSQSAQQLALSALKNAVDAGNDVNEKNKDGHSGMYLLGDALGLCDASPVPEAIMTLLAARADVVSVRLHGGCNVLHEATKRGCVELIDPLIRAGIEANDGDEARRTPLWYVASYYDGARSVSAIRTLLVHKADPNLADCSGETPLHVAHTGNAVRLLVDNKADIEAKDLCEATPLITAASRGHLEQARALIACRADMRAREAMNDRTALDEAKNSLHYDECKIRKAMVKLLEKYDEPSAAAE